MNNKNFSKKNKSTFRPVVINSANKPAKPVSKQTSNESEPADAPTMMRAYQILAADGIVKFHSFCDLKEMNDADREVVIRRYNSAYGRGLRLL